ncbi:glycosyl transferase [Ophiocordyceps camponoti-floridani]|uniref:Glycosyl transferase n=1 Tax=Ophiocordyceps camponoti-floridani TaxID=2030778 RepID=A0A8H4Q7H2_9HYPO|nr:glycosyl transferase [Ophiocordyceps camponoti-floridani]
MTPPPIKAIIIALIITASLFYLIRQHETPLLTGPKPQADNKTIPNLVNLVYLVPSETSDLGFEFSHFLCAYAARHHLGPTSHLLLHTNADTASVARARTGQSGKWARLLLGLPGLRVRHVSSPNATGPEERGGKPLRYAEHRSDFVRVAAAREFGGLYIDFDVFVLRDLRPLREAGFGAVVGREVTDQVNSGVFLTRPNGLLISRWEERMPVVYDGGWVTHSNVALTRISESLVSESPGSVLIMERNAFAPGGWGDQDYDRLWGTHREEETGWEVDYSRTYMLHAFMPYRAGHAVRGFDRLLPRYVLERRSNFARALYPVVSLMLEQRLVGWNDSFDGR